MEAERILSLLGLALRGGNLIVGEEPVEAVARARDARLLLLASDAAANTRRRIIHFADVGKCLWAVLPATKQALGSAVGRPSVAIVAVTDIGLANAVAERLAQLDPKTYGDLSQRLKLKAQRAEERRTEQRAHEKNVRQGKKKAKQPAPAAEATVPTPKKKSPAGSKEGVSVRKSRPSKENRPKPRAKTNPYAHSRPVKKGKGSFRKKDA